MQIPFATTALTLAMLALTALPAAAQPPTCAGRTACTEVTSFVAAVTDFRPSMQGRMRLVALTVRFQNRTDRVLRLAYVAGSGLVTDDQGNRYQVHAPDAVRGLGQVTSNAFDPKFELQPGESADARLEMAWNPAGTEVVGTRYTAELTVREIVPVGVGQLRLGREHALQFRALGAPAVADAGSAALPADAPAQAVSVSSPGRATAAVAGDAMDACAGAARCYAAGPFTAQVTNLSSSRVGNAGHHVLRFTVRLRNVGGAAMTLAYKGGSGVVTDELGNRYYWGRPGTYDMSATGIGTAQGRKVDPQFVLGPGQSRDATFELIRYNPGQTALGTTFTYDLTLAQLEVLNGGAIREVRDYAVGFRDVREGSSAPAADAAARAGAKLMDGLRKRLGGKPR